MTSSPIICGAFAPQECLGPVLECKEVECRRSRRERLAKMHREDLAAANRSDHQRDEPSDPEALPRNFQEARDRSIASIIDAINRPKLSPEAMNGVLIASALLVLGEALNEMREAFDSFGKAYLASQDDS